MPMISTIIPTHNGGKFIRDTLDSALAQSYRDFEIIVVDDGSTDDTAQILATYGTQVNVITAHVGNVAGARNAGIAAARGEWIALLDHDDLWDQDKLERQVNLLTSTGADMVYGQIRVSRLQDDGEGLVVMGRGFDDHSSVFEGLLYGNGIPSITAVFRRSLFESVGGFDPLTAPADDYDMWCRIARHHQIVFQQEIMGTRRVHDVNFTTRHWDKMAAASELVFRRAIQLAPEGVDVQRAIHYHYIRVAGYWSRAGRSREAVDRLQRAWRTGKPDRRLAVSTGRIALAALGLNTWD